MKKIAILMVSLICVGTFLLAQQGPSGPPDPAMMAQHQVQMLTNALNLTSAQQEQAGKIFVARRLDQQAAMQSARQAIAAAVKANDTAAIDKAAATLGNLTAQSAAARAKADAAFYQILTAEQKQKLDQMRQQRGPGMGPGGPGQRGRGPGGPGANE